MIKYKRIFSLSIRNFTTDLKKIDAKSLIIKKSENLKELVPNNKLIFGKTFTDHIFEIRWKNESGWSKPIIKPFENFNLSPASSVFHYGMTCFEGLKAFKDKEGRTRLFRPDWNMNRLQTSAKRIYLPEFDKKELLECLKSYLKVEDRWIPNQEGYSLYIRPTFMGIQPSLGVGPSNEAVLFFLACPVGPYYATGFEPVSLYATTEHVRAWPGGTGNCKLGGNYAPTIPAQISAQREGCQQVLWLFGEQKNITEVGTMNLFIVLKRDGKTELVTPPLDGTILPGAVRDSILSLAREWREFTVSERSLTLKGLLEMIDNGEVQEIFGCGTAAVVSPVDRIRYKGKDYRVPIDNSDGKQKAGPLARRFYKEITMIQYGYRKNHPWSVLI